MPIEFTAYKAVKKFRRKYFSPIYKGAQLEKNNRLKSISFYSKITTGGKYKPYYHAFKTIAACRSVELLNPSMYTFLKIRIKRKDVTCIGGQGENNKPPYYKVIVSRAFTTKFEEVKI